jgi:phage N-6-adenine-methyltransferase
VSLVGFRAQNHVQQVLVHGPRSHVDDRAVTPEDFATWHRRFCFTIDAASSVENARLPRFWTITDDALRQDWTGERVWCNPPYSSIEPWCEKAHGEWLLRGRSYGGPELIVMLLPANRTEQGWWQRQVEPFRDGRGDLTVEFLPGKPGQKRIGANERPLFGCCLLIWGHDGERRDEAAAA